MEIIIILAAFVPLVFTPRLTFNCFGLPQTLALGLLSATGLVLGVAKGFVPISTPSILTFIFLGYAAVSIMWAFPTHNARKEFGLQGSLLIFFLICMAYLSPSGVEKFAVAMTISAGLVCLYANVQTHSADPFFDNRMKRGGAINRPIGTIGNPNFLAGFIAGSFWFGWYASASVHWGLLIIPMFCLYVLYKTGSRAGQLAAVGSILFFLMVAAWFGKLPEQIANFHYDQKMFFHLTLSMGFMAALLIFYLLKFNWETFWRKPIDPKGPQVWYATFRYRLCYFLPALYMIREKPLFGWGMRAYRREIYQYQALVNQKFPDFLNPDRYITQQPRRVHNDILEHGTEYGIFGSLIYLMIIACCYYMGFKYLAGAEGKSFFLMLILLSSVSATLIDGLFFFPLRLATNSIPFYAAMASVYAIAGGKVVQTGGSLGLALIAVFLGGAFVWYCLVKRWLASYFFIRYLEMRNPGRDIYLAIHYAPHDSIYRTHALISALGMDSVASSEHSQFLVKFFDGMTPLHQSLMNAAMARADETSVLDEAELYAKQAHYLQPHWDAPKRMLNDPRIGLSLKCKYKGGLSAMKQVNEGTQWKLKALMQRKDVINMQVGMLQKDIEKLQTEIQLAEAVLQNALLVEKRRLNVPDDWTYNVEAGRFENPHNPPPSSGIGVMKQGPNTQAT